METDHKREEDQQIIDVYLTERNEGKSGVTYVWNAKSAFLIREKYRLLGDFTGCLPKHTAQNQYLALPLALSYEETCLGVERGFLRVVSDSPKDDYRVLNDEDREEIEEGRRQDREEQMLATEKKHREARAKALAKKSEVNMTRGKKRKRQSLETVSNNEEPQRKLRKIGEGIFSRVITLLRHAADWIRQQAPFLDSFRGPPAKPLLVGHINGNHATHTGGHATAQVSEGGAEKGASKSNAAREGATVTLTPTEARPCERYDVSRAISRIPPPVGVDTKRLADRRAVFTDLYNKGFYLSCGAKFGADFLAYAAEPLLFHAVIAVIVTDKDEPLSTYDVVAFGRLGDSTKKRTMLAYVADRSTSIPKIEYVGIQWEETLP